MFLKALGALVKYNTNIAMKNIGFVFKRNLYFFEKDRSKQIVQLIRQLLENTKDLKTYLQEIS